MTVHDACEQAYRNGYERGYISALNDILNHYNKHVMSIPQLVEYVAKQKEINI